jgi:hypothetical protein
MDAAVLPQAVELSSRAEQRVRQFREDRIGKILSGNAPLSLMDEMPLFVAHLVPLAIGPRQQDITTDEEIWQHHGRHLKPLGTSGHNYRYNIDGLLTYDPDKKDRAYVQFFRTGAIESVVVPDAGDHYIPLVTLIDELVGFYLEKYLAIQEALGVGLPIVVMFTLLKAEGWVISSGPPTIDGPFPFDRKVIRAPEVVLQSFEGELEEKMKPAITALWNAGGVANAPRYDSRF